jgi:hypothetical protein
MITSESSKRMALNKNTVLLLLLIFCYVIVIRIPQLTSDNLLPDQDECVLGMMANHFLKGQNFPLFFYGQHYGLSTLEVLLIAPFIKLFGISTIAIKLPMLLLYMAAITFLFLWIRNNLGLSYAFLITLFFAAEPTWLTWAMKARGGYLSALFIGFYLLYQWQNTADKSKMYLFNAFLMGLLYHFHLLWFLAFAPLFMYYQRHLERNKIIKAAIVIALTIAVFYVLAFTSEALWFRPSSQFQLDVDFNEYRKNFMVFLGGHFYFGYAYGLRYGAILSTKVLFAVHLLIIFLAIFYILKNRFFNEILLWFLMVLFIFLLPVLATKGVFHFRYWLPLSVVFIGLMMALIKEFRSNKINKLLIVVVLVTAFFGYRAGKDIASMDIYSDYFIVQKDHREVQIKSLIATLKENNKKYYLCNDIAIMWLLNYFGNDEILLRWRINKDRHNKQVQEINKYYVNNKKIDLFGSQFSFKEWLPDTAHLKLKWINKEYYLIENIEASILAKHNYKFEN